MSREEQDAWSVRSHQRAAEAEKAGGFDAELLSIEVPQRKGDPIVVDCDETIRADTSSEALGRFHPACQADVTVTAGNAPGVNDVAAAVCVTSWARAEERGIGVLALVVAYATSGTEPELVMMVPAQAIDQVTRQDRMGPIRSRPV